MPAEKTPHRVRTGVCRIHGEDRQEQPPAARFRENGEFPREIGTDYVRQRPNSFRSARGRIGRFESLAESVIFYERRRR